MARVGLPATSFALLLFIAFGILATLALVVGLGRWGTGLTWAGILLVGIAIVAVVVMLVRRNGGQLAREP